jgi:hypothetical protein
VTLLQCTHFTMSVLDEEKAGYKKHANYMLVGALVLPGSSMSK